MVKHFCPSDDPFFLIEDLPPSEADGIHEGSPWLGIMVDWETICCSDFSDSICSYGINYLHQFISSFIQTALDFDVPNINLKMMAGC